jgi:hypothetical protein
VIPSSTPVTIRDIFNEVQTDLFEAGLKWFSQDDIFAAIQSACDKVNALLGLIDHTTFIPQIGSPYYDFRQIPDFMYVTGIYNPSTLLWLEGMSYRMMKAVYQTYLAFGNPQYYNIADFYRLTIWPFNTVGSGVLFVVYKAIYPKIFIPGPNYNGDGYYNWDHIPLLPYSIAKQVLEYFAVADLMEQAREFSKAKLWWGKLLNPPKDEKGFAIGSSVLEQAKIEVADLARADKENVLEPYRWIFHGGQSGVVTWINNELPSGTIDGTNAVFNLANVPNPSSSVLLMKNGQCLFSGVGYTLNGQTITFQTGYIPQPASGSDVVGDLLRAWYQIQ